MLLNKHIVQKAAARVEEVRLAVRADPDSWAGLAGMHGIQERWLRAFASGQIKQPPANRFLAIERWLMERRVISRRA
jgi:hypothetical protein